MKAGRNEMGFDGSAAFDEGWWPEGSARIGAFLVACLMGVAMILLASAPAEATGRVVALTPGDHRVEADYSGAAHFQPSRGVMDKVNVGSGRTRVLPRTGSSTVPLALLAAAFMVSGVLIQRRANRIDAEKMPPEDYRF